MFTPAENGVEFVFEWSLNLLDLQSAVFTRFVDSEASSGSRCRGHGPLADRDKADAESL